MANKHPYKIFFIEDEPELAQLFSSALEMAGFLVKVTLNADNVVDEVKKFKPDLILLDLVLPHKDGYQILRELKQDVEAKKYKIYAFSNLSQKKEIEVAQKLGVEEYWIKSDFTPNKLVEKITEALGDN